MISDEELKILSKNTSTITSIGSDGLIPKEQRVIIGIDALAGELLEARRKLSAIAENAALVFYCKDCNEIITAVICRENVLNDMRQEIADCIEEGYRMAVIPTENVRKETWCSCENKDISGEGGGEV